MFCFYGFTEKVALLEKIADLEKQIQAQHTISVDTKLDLERIIDLKSGNEVELRQKLDSLEQMVRHAELYVFYVYLFFQVA